MNLQVREACLDELVLQHERHKLVERLFEYSCHLPRAAQRQMLNAALDIGELPEVHRDPLAQLLRSEVVLLTKLSNELPCMERSRLAAPSLFSEHHAY